MITRSTGGKCALKWQLFTPIILAIILLSSMLPTTPSNQLQPYLLDCFDNPTHDLCSYVLGKVSKLNKQAQKGDDTFGNQYGSISEMWNRELATGALKDEESIMPAEIMP